MAWRGWSACGIPTPGCSTCRSASAAVLPMAASWGTTTCWWRPETDTLRFAPQQRYLLHRPVFQDLISGESAAPNLAGRVAAAFALAAQVRARTDETEARRLLDLAAGVFDGGQGG